MYVVEAVEGKSTYSTHSTLHTHIYTYYVADVASRPFALFWPAYFFVGVVSLRRASLSSRSTLFIFFISYATLRCYIHSFSTHTHISPIPTQLSQPKHTKISTTKKSQDYHVNFKLTMLITQIISLRLKPELLKIIMELTRR